MSHPSHTQLSTHLSSTKNLTPTPTWLTTFLTTQRPSTPLPALIQTATFRLLASDITTSLSPSASTCLPTDVNNVNIKERKLAGAITVQVLGVEDMSKSRWEQIEAIEALERGEGTKGREIIRVVAAEEGEGDDGAQKSGGPHKLLLKDAAGKRAYGIELRAVEGVGLGMSIGCKVVLKGAIVARGMVLLEPATTMVLGGKIEALHKAWKEGRKAELRKAIEDGEQWVRERG
ncbi:hypothetical protein ACLMJK_000346 [Lecanora helva]